MRYLLLILLLFGNFAYSQCQGDVNEDFSVDVQDVVLILGSILDDDEIDYDVADMNEDGSIDLLDIIGVVNIILQFGSECGDGICDNEYSDLDGTLISCDVDCEESNGDCYYSGDLVVLQDIVDSNDNLFGIDPLDLDPDYPYDDLMWEDGRLIFLSLSINLTLVTTSLVSFP